MSKPAFQGLCNTYLKGTMCEREDTNMRACIPIEKRLAVFLDWACSSMPFQALAKPTCVNIVHDVVEVLSQKFCLDMIKFPEGADLMRVMNEFKGLCYLPFCAGAIDGTFMKIEKPREWGDTYFCYKKFTAIILFACVDARGKFTYVNAGQPGSVGDAFTLDCSDLKRKIESKSWLNVPDEFLPHMRLDDATFQPFLCADSAFALSPSLMKCFEVDHPTHEQFNFNYALIRMRRVVECAFGRLKKRFPILKNSRLSDPIFAQKVLGVLCALHNYIEGFGVENMLLHDAGVLNHLTCMVCMEM